MRAFKSGDNIEFKGGKYKVVVNLGDGATIEVLCDHVLITPIFLMTASLTSYHVIPIDKIYDMVIVDVSETTSE